MTTYDDGRIPWPAYEEGALPDDLVDAKQVQPDGRLIVSTPDGARFDVHGRTTEDYDGRDIAEYPVYPVRYLVNADYAETWDHSPAGGTRLDVLTFYGSTGRLVLTRMMRGTSLQSINIVYAELAPEYCGNENPAVLELLVTASERLETLAAQDAGRVEQGTRFSYFEDVGELEFICTNIHSISL